MEDVIIIGAGIIGSFIARNLSKYKLKVLVIEKDNDVCNETSMANSAIIHSGYDPVPNSLKAKLNVKGNMMFDNVAKELDVSFKRIGSITVAFDDSQLATLKELQKRALENGVETTLLDNKQVHELEPFLSNNVIGGLYAKTAGIIDPFNLGVSLMENAIDNGVKLILNEKVISIKKDGDVFTINGKYTSKMVINASGVYSDFVNELINEKSFNITPRAGQYVVLNHFKMPFVTHTLFMVPSEKGKGVLISPTTSGNYIIGPSANEVEIEDKSTDRDTINDIKRQANLMVDNIPYYESIRTFSGIRATGSTHDFIIKESETKNFINVAGIESPGIASSPAISEMVENLVVERLHPELNKSFNPYIRKHIKLKELDINTRNKLISENKDYGKIVCKCEQISKGEIIDCLNRSCPPRSIKALKKRLRVGFGKCQGGMCQSLALDILASFYHVDKKDIPYDGKDAYILLTHTKEIEDERV